MDSPDQGVFGIPVDSVTFQGNRLHVACVLVKALQAGGHQDYQIQELKDLNHLFHTTHISL